MTATPAAPKINRQRATPTLKKVIRRSIPDPLWNGLRDAKSAVTAAISDRPLRREVRRLLDDRDAAVPLRSDLDLLLKLHDAFDGRQFGNSYDGDVILPVARERFDLLRSRGIDLAGRDLVEYGAGHGAMLFVADEVGARRAVAIDYDAVDFEKLRAEHGDPTVDHEFVAADLCDYAPPAGAFDVALCDNAFEHFADPAVVLDKIHTTLRPGGVLLARFNPIFHSALGGHRYWLTAVPWVQTIFDDETNWRFFQDHLRLSESTNLYTGEAITDRDPFPEMNRWRPGQYEAIFLDGAKWQPVRWTRQSDRRQAWFAELFMPEVPELTRADWFTSGYEFLLRKV